MIEQLADILNGGAPRISPAEHEAFLEAAAEHGVTCLLAEQCRAASGEWPAPLREALADIRRRECLLEELRLTETRRVLDAFAGAHVPVLTIKGTALAYTHYEVPWLRPRCDTDLLIARGDVWRARRVLEALGYREPPFISGELVMHQADYRRDDRGMEHRCDLHWRNTNPAVFADLLPFEAVVQRARVVPRIGPAVLTLDPADALLLACVHRVAHHRSERLIWLYDLHLLARDLDGDAASRFVRDARDCRVQAICADGLRAARRWLATPLAEDLQALAEGQAAAEPSAVFLRADRRRLDTLLWDVRALDGWGARLRLLREHLLPPPTYIRRRYGISRGWALPFCYAHRAVTGAARWVKRTD